MPYLLALDQGTTSSRAILFDESGAPVAADQQEFPPDASVQADVAGPMTAQVNGTDAGSLALAVGSSATVAATKTYDDNEQDAAPYAAEPVGGGGDLDAIAWTGCPNALTKSAPVVSLGNGSPSANASASTLTVVGAVEGSCTLTATNANTGESVSVSVKVSSAPTPTPPPTATPVPAVTVWPNDLAYPMQGYEQNANCSLNQPVEYANANFTKVQANDTPSTGFGSLGTDGPYASDANGCLVYNANTASGGSISGSAIDDTKTGGAGVSVFASGTGELYAKSVSSDACGNLNVTFEGQGGTLQEGPTGNFVVTPLARQAPCEEAVLDQAEYEDVGYTPVAGQIVTIEVSSPCVAEQTCYAEVSTAIWAIYAGGDCNGGDQCVEYQATTSYYSSSDNGKDWTAGNTCTNLDVYVNDVLFSESTGCPATGLAGPAPGFTYTLTDSDPEHSTGGIVLGTGAWSPTTPPGTNGIALP